MKMKRVTLTLRADGEWRRWYAPDNAADGTGWIHRTDACQLMINATTIRSEKIHVKDGVILFTHYFLEIEE